MHSGDDMTLEATASTTQSAEASGLYDGKIAGLYDLKETLGSGHFAVVKMARHVFTGAKVAVKVVDKTKLDDVSKAHLFQEVRCMKLVQHPNVVRLYEVIDTHSKLYLVLELGDGGDLYDYIMKHEGGLTEDLARKYFRQILRAISYCHQLHVVHRDLKPENVVFFEKLGVVKLTDFGFSNKFSPGQKLETFCGSLAYSAPEILLGDSYDAPAVDIWSLGVILYMLVCGQPPFEKANDSETLIMIMDCKYTMPPQVSCNCRNLIGSMLVRDPKKRLSLELIANHPWIKKNSDCEPSDYLPLVSHQELSEEDHAFIIQKMINGNIASKEDILQALDKNKYNHITATYFLLAEIRLRKRREEEIRKQPLIAGNATMSKRQVPDIKVKSVDDLLPTNINVCSQTSYASESKTDKRSRKCSIVREEDEDEPAYENLGEMNELRVASMRRESISDGRLNHSVQDRTCNTSVMPLQIHTKMVGPIDGKLVRKLNKIDGHKLTMVPHENVALTDVKKRSLAVEDALNPMDMQDTLRGLKQLEIGSLKPFTTGNKNPVVTHRRTKPTKIRTPSCSSSEASDDDTKVRSKKKINKFVGDTPTRFRMHRRDSHDDSSDSQDQPFPSTGAHGHATSLIDANKASVSGEKDGQKQSKEQNKCEETRKSSHSHSQKNKKHPKDQIDKHAKSDKQSLPMICVRRRRIRESQSLDRITEAQEYELWHRCLAVDSHVEQKNTLCNLKSIAVFEANEEYDQESADNLVKTERLKSNLKSVIAAVQLKGCKNNIHNLNSIDEVNLILEDKSLTKIIQVAGSKCFVTMKKIRLLGKYFPIVNFS